MATVNVDPSKVKFPPEVLIEAVDQATVSTGGETVSSYLMTDKWCSVESFEVDPIAAMDVIVSADGFGEKMKIRANSIDPVDGGTTMDEYRVVKLLAKKTLSVQNIMTTGSATHAYHRYAMCFRKPTIVDKIREGEPLTANEENIANMPDRNLRDNISMGRIPRWSSLLGDDVYKQFDEIFVVGRTLAALAASSDTVIGNTIHASGKVGVLLGVWADTASFSTPSDSYITVDRDADYDYQKLDLTAMPDQITVRCFIPFIDQLTVSIVSATGTGVTTVPCGFVYGIRRATIIDHQQWGDKFPYRSQQEEIEAMTMLANYPQIVTDVLAGAR